MTGVFFLERFWVLEFGERRGESIGLDFGVNRGLGEFGGVLWMGDRNLGTQYLFLSEHHGIQSRLDQFFRYSVQF